MKVLLVVHQFPSREHPYITEWAVALQQAGVDLLVLSETLPTNDAYADGLRIGYLNQIHPSVLRQWPNLARLPGALLSSGARRAWRVLHDGEKTKRTALRKFYEYLPWLNEKVDLVHFNAPQIAVRRFELGKLFNAPTLVSFRGQDFTFHPDRYDSLLAQADHLHFISEHLVNEATKRGYAGDKHTIIYPAIDTDFYSPLHMDKDDPKDRGFALFTAARFEWVKGLDFAIQAVSILVKKGWDIQYFIAGDGSMRTAVEFAARQLGVAERIHLLGWQNEEEVRQHMRNADVYLLTSVTEGFNNSVVQAQACGLPVVCSDVGGLPENIRDGVTGLLAKCRDPWDTADKIELLLRDELRRVEIGVNARHHAAIEFSLSNNIKQFIATYDSLAHLNK